MARVRQAVVIVHGMGEQRPLDMLNGFIEAALPPRDDGRPKFYSQPDRVTDSFESRRYIAARFPDDDGTEARPQTDFYEYHWAHLMQGNTIGDLWPTFRRMLFTPVQRIPAGLRLVWVVFWAGLLTLFWAFATRRLTWVGGESDAATVLRTIVGTGLAGTAAVYLLKRVLPGALTNTFVDVVRYLDTSPRSYEVRRQIRKGMVDLLQGLHEERYQRVVVVAHSLGAYIAYDGICYLWAHVNKLHARSGSEPAGLADVERLASDLAAEPDATQRAARRAAYRDAQRALWLGLRADGNPWLVTDFVSVGTPMYMADRLYTRNEAEFRQRVARWEFPTCPPQSEGTSRNNAHRTARWFAWRSGGRRVLYHGAPFAPVRWTNLWFPARWGVLGDWFGGPLAPLFGAGVDDRPLPRTGLRHKGPWAHTKYFTMKEGGDGLRALRTALDLDAKPWLEATLRSPAFDEATRKASATDDDPAAAPPPRPRRAARKKAAPAP